MLCQPFSATLTRISLLTVQMSRASSCAAGSTFSPHDTARRVSESFQRGQFCLSLLIAPSCLSAAPTLGETTALLTCTHVSRTVSERISPTSPEPQCSTLQSLLLTLRTSSNLVVLLPLDVICGPYDLLDGWESPEAGPPTPSPAGGQLLSLWDVS